MVLMSQETAASNLDGQCKINEPQSGVPLNLRDAVCNRVYTCTVRKLGEWAKSGEVQMSDWGK